MIYKVIQLFTGTQFPFNKEMKNHTNNSKKDWKRKYNTNLILNYTNSLIYKWTFILRSQIEWDLKFLSSKNQKWGTMLN